MAPINLYVQEWRKARGLSVLRLAEMSGIARQTLIAIEKKETLQPHRSTMQMIAESLRCTLESLYEPPPKDTIPFNT